MRIILTTLSAKNIHKSLAPWCLKAYCESQVQGCEIMVQEYTVNDPAGSIVDQIYQSKPKVVGFSCYIWNIEHVVKVARMLKKCLPGCIIILGGPEVSFEKDCGAYPFANYIVQGAGEASFAQIIHEIKGGMISRRMIVKSSTYPDFDVLAPPYTVEYHESFQEGRMASIKNQLVYYESSRGCPFSCTYCLSSTFCGVEELPLERVFADLDGLLVHGATCIKFVDRSFNANKGRAFKIFQYILSLDTDCTFHFEAVADLFDSELLQLISLMPSKRVQFEIGIQSTNPATLAEINRVMDIEKAFQNIQALVAMDNHHVHVDLISGLPFDTLDTFSRSIDQCIQVRPHMLQLGLLKLLKGTKIRENSAAYGYVFNDFPPYEAFRSNDMSVEDIIMLKGVAAAIDKFYNTGMFASSVSYGIDHVFQSASQFFFALADFCRGKNPKASLKQAYAILLDFLCLHVDDEIAQHYIKLDCLTFDSKGVLPDGITARRDRKKEKEFKRTSSSKYSNVRIEFFDYDKKTRMFIYDEKDEIRKSHKVIYHST